MQRLPPGSGRERQTLRKLEKVAFCHFFDTLWRRLHPRLHRLPSKSPPSLFEDFHIPLAVCARLAAHRVPNPLNPLGRQELLPAPVSLFKSVEIPLRELGFHKRPDCFPPLFCRELHPLCKHPQQHNVCRAERSALFGDANRIKRHSIRRGAHAGKRILRIFRRARSSGCSGAPSCR